MIAAKAYEDEMHCMVAETQAEESWLLLVVVLDDETRSTMAEENLQKLAAVQEIETHSTGRVETEIVAVAEQGQLVTTQFFLAAGPAETLEQKYNYY